MDAVIFRDAGERVKYRELKSEKKGAGRLGVWL